MVSLMVCHLYLWHLYQLQDSSVTYLFGSRWASTISLWWNTRTMKPTTICAFPCLWVKEVIRRSEKSPDEIAAALSILGHLMRNLHVSDRERPANITILTIAGHGTSSHTLQWISWDAIMRRLLVLARLTSDWPMIDYCIRWGGRWPYFATPAQ